MVDSEKKWEESFETALENLEKYSEPRILNALEILDGNNVGLKFQFKMLRNW